MKKLPKISVNIPLVTNGDASVVLNALKKIDYPKKLYETIIVEGRQIAKQRNVALKHSTGKILYLLDNDSLVQPNSFKILAKEFSKPEVAAVGGPSLTKKGGGTYFNELIALTLETYFGAMRMRFRYSSQADTKGTEYRLIGANLALRKTAVKKVGKFNENIVPNEETELLRRLKKAGYELKYVRSLYIHRNHRKNITSLVRQFHHYGKGRMKQMKNDFNEEDIIFIMLIGFYIYLVSLIFYHPIWYLIPLFSYVLLAGATSIKATIKYRKLNLLIAMTTLFPIIHTSYFLGLIQELLSSTNKGKERLKSLKKITNVIKIH